MKKKTYSKNSCDPDVWQREWYPEYMRNNNLQTAATRIKCSSDVIKNKYSIKKIKHLYVWLFCLHEYIGTVGTQRKSLDPLELGLLKVVNHWVYGFELRFFLKTANVLFWWVTPNHKQINWIHTSQKEIYRCPIKLSKNSFSSVIGKIKVKTTMRTSSYFR